MAERARLILGGLSNWFKQLSGREKQLVFVAAAVLLSFALYNAAVRLRAAYETLDMEILRAEADLSTISHLLERYSKVKSDRDRIESEYRSFEFKEGDLSYLEDLIRRKMSLAPGSFTITPRASGPFGENYEQNPFSIKFSTGDMDKLFDFLTDLVSGSQPLLLTRLDLRVNRTGEAVEVDVDVSSIRQKRAAAT